MNIKDPKETSKPKRKATLVHVPNDAASDTIFVKTIGRNDPCPCGSGKKAKNCCKRYKEYYYKRKGRYVTPSINDLGDKL